jgi:hypothetical protein
MKKILLIIGIFLTSTTVFSCENYSGRWEVGDHYYWLVTQPDCSEIKLEIVISGNISEIQNYKIDDKWYCDKNSSNYEHATCLKARWENSDEQMNIILTLARYENGEGGLRVSDTYFTNQEKLEMVNKYQGGVTWGRSWLRKKPHITKPSNGV